MRAVIVNFIEIHHEIRGLAAIFFCSFSGETSSTGSPSRLPFPARFPQNRKRIAGFIGAREISSTFPRRCSRSAARIARERDGERGRFVLHKYWFELISSLFSTIRLICVRGDKRRSDNKSAAGRFNRFKTEAPFRAVFARPFSDSFELGIFADTRAPAAREKKEELAPPLSLSLSLSLFLSVSLSFARSRVNVQGLRATAVSGVLNRGHTEFSTLTY